MNKLIISHLNVYVILRVSNDWTSHSMFNAFQKPYPQSTYSNDYYSYTKFTSSGLNIVIKSYKQRVVMNIRRGWFGGGTSVYYVGVCAADVRIYV